jgi:hypothetical protein
MTAHKHRISSGVALGLALVAAAAPSASARLLDEPTAAPATPSSAAPTVIHVAAPSGGFDWGDAGIGAGGTLTLITAAAGGAIAIGNRRGRRQADRPATTR